MKRTALITGGSRGLGETVAAFLAGQNYDLILTARTKSELYATAGTLAHYNVKVIALAGDVVDAGHRYRLTHAARELGRLDILFNNASSLGQTPLPALTRYAPDILEHTFRTNVVAPLALIQETRSLLESSGGLVVNISSDAARGGYPGWGGYGLTKAALDLASLTLANELEDTGVSVVSVDPGDLRTRMHQEAFPGEDISDRPLPETTLPFWAWLFEQPREAVNGMRYQAQAEHWEIREPVLI